MKSTGLQCFFLTTSSAGFIIFWNAYKGRPRTNVLRDEFAGGIK